MFLASQTPKYYFMSEVLDNIFFPNTNIFITVYITATLLSSNLHFFNANWRVA